MTSAVTQRIGIGVANTITPKPTENTTRPEINGLDQKQVHDQLRISAQAASHSFARKERADAVPQTPKRVESPYGPNRKKKKPGPNSEVESEEKSPKKEAGLDVLV